MADALLKNEASEIYQLAKRHNIPLQRVPKEKLDRMTRLAHQGVIAISAPVEFYVLEDLVDHLFYRGIHPCLGLLEGVTDVRNFGAIARSAEVFGLDGLVIGQSRSAPINQESIKASAGALLKIPICREKNLAQSVTSLKGMGFTVVGSVTENGTQLRQLRFDKPMVFVVGSEGEGISRNLLELCDERVSIPQKGDIGSLNVSVASAILFYEWSLQNNRG